MAAKMPPPRSPMGMPARKGPMPGVPVIAIFWGLAGDNSRYLDGIEATESDIVTTGLKETVRHILAFARRTSTPLPALTAAK